MCRCKYPKYINRKNIEIIEDENKERCYKVSFELGKQGKNILIIGRAPRTLEEESCSDIYKRIIKFLDKNMNFVEGIRNLTIVNLFSVYEGIQGDIYEDFLLNGKEYIEGNDGKLKNDEIISEEIKNADYIIIAWGEPIDGLKDIYGSRVEFILRELRNNIMNSESKKLVMTVGELSKKGYPKHCLAWSYKDELQNLW